MNSTDTIPTVEAALAEPLDFDVSHSQLGWTLNSISLEFALCISARDAARIIRAQRRAITRERHDETRACGFRRF